MKKCLFVVLCSTLMICFSICIGAASVEWNGHVYTLYEGSFTLEEAKAKAQEVNGFLVTIESDAEAVAVESLLKKATGDAYWLGETYWLGASYTKDSFVWEFSGVPVEEVGNFVWAENTSFSEQMYVSGNTWMAGDASPKGYIVEKYDAYPVASVLYNNTVYSLYDHVLTKEGAASFASSLHTSLVPVGDAALLSVLQDKLLPYGQMEGYRLAEGNVLFSDGTVQAADGVNIGLITAVSAELSISTPCVSYGGSTYYRVDTPLSWHDANMAARAYGGRLAALQSPEMQKKLPALYEGARYESYWVGGCDAYKEYTFHSTDGSIMTPLSDFGWLSYQPNNEYGLEDFLEVRTERNTLNDTSVAPHFGGFTDRGFILEIPPMQAPDESFMFGANLYFGYDDVTRLRAEDLRSTYGQKLVDKSFSFAALSMLQSKSTNKKVWLDNKNGIYTDGSFTTQDMDMTAAAFVAVPADFTVEDYTEDDNYTYVLYKGAAQEVTAEAFCQAMGGFLAKADSDEVYKTLQSLVQSGSMDSYYFGGGLCIALDDSAEVVDKNRFCYVLDPEGNTKRVNGKEETGFILALPKEEHEISLIGDAFVKHSDHVSTVYRMKNTTEKSVEATALLAFYDEDGRLLSVQSEKKDVSAFDIVPVEKDFEIKGAEKVRLMLLTTVAKLAPVTEASEQEETTFVEKGEQEKTVYEDFSYQIKNTSAENITTISRSANGEFMTAGLSLVFEPNTNLFTLGPIHISNGYIIDAINDPTCGYVTHNGKSAFKIAKNSKNQAGFLVTLMSPLPAETVTSMTMTYMTDGDAPNSSARVLRSDASLNSAMVNNYQSVALSGATSDWKTVDLCMENMNAIADSSGQIRAFKFYIRDKNATNYYIRSINFENSVEAYSRVTLTENDIRYASGALKAVADAIEEKLTAASIQMDFTVTLVSYTANTTAADGKITYNVTFASDEVNATYTNRTAVVPKLKNAWLNTSGEYSGTHDSKGQIQTNFNNSGVLYLNDNTLACTEGIKTVEYAVVPKNTDYDDASIVWHKAQSLKLGGGGIASLYINAFMDYGDALEPHETYRMMVRGVTNNDNYILHLDVPFGYTPHNEKAEEILLRAKKKIEELPPFVLTEASRDAASTYIQNTIRNAVDDPFVAIHFSPKTLGHSGFIYELSLALHVDVATDKHPYFVLGSEKRSDFYGLTGDAFTMKNQIAWLNQNAMDADITLLAPTDGTNNIVLANAATWGYMNEPFTDTLVGKYSDLVTENTHPVPIAFAWEDNGSDAYKLYIDSDVSFLEPWVFTVTDTKTNIYNLCVDTTYYWYVEGGGETSPVYRFRTSGNQPRLIYAPGVLNVRDTGGWITADGKRVKQGMFYRSALLENITKEGLYQMHDVLGIKTDLDLRGNGGVSPLGADVQMIACPMQWYGGIFNTSAYEATRVAISAFAYEENYPIVYHCSLGRDRTGTVAILILGLLGADQTTLHREYMLSLFSSVGGESDKIAALNPNFYGLMSTLNSYKSSSASLSENIEAYLLDTGVTKAEIASIKKLLLEDITITFNDQENGYSLSAVGLTHPNSGDIINSVNDAACGYVKKYGLDAYKIAPNAIGRSGFMMTLDRPIKASSVSSMTITYTSDIDGGASSARVLPQTATSHDQMCNDYRASLLTGGTEKFVTMDMLVSDFSAMADSDGYIRKFKFYIRDTAGTNYYIKDITFK